jgi:transposase-like protein
MSKRGHSLEDKIKIIKALEDGSHTISELEFIYKVHQLSIYDWVYKYEKYGVEGLKNSFTWGEYSKELKLAAVKDYLSGEYSIREVTRKYELSSTSTLRRWISKYNSHRELKDTSNGRTNTMTKGRKTTLDERIQIVLYCLENGKDYQKTAEAFKVSYQQAYQWVKKYEDVGEEALEDKRGKKKEEVELSPEQKLKLEMQKLERENERLRAENAFLKKLEEIERRRK